jgi:hypothetical protein
MARLQFTVLSLNYVSDTFVISKKLLPTSGLGRSYRKWLHQSIIPPEFSAGLLSMFFFVYEFITISMVLHIYYFPFATPPDKNKLLRCRFIYFSFFLLADVAGI